MQAIYLVYPYDGCDRPLAAFHDHLEAERFARHSRWAHRDSDPVRVEAVPVFDRPAPAYTLREATEEKWAAADELWDPRDEDGWRGTVDEDGEACDGRA